MFLESDFLTTIKKEMKEYDRYVKDCPVPMTKFQIERLLIGQHPPTGRYFQCCLEITKRSQDIKAIIGDPNTSEKLKIQKIDVLKREIEIFRELADLWFPLTNGKSYEELQPIIWDEYYLYKICISILSGDGISQHIPDVLCLPRNSRSRMIFEKIMAQEISVEKTKEIVEGELRYFESDVDTIAKYVTETNYLQR
jgi:hypothetical protein